jgi:hypothetical protein
LKKKGQETSLSSNKEERMAEDVAKIVSSVLEVQKNWKTSAREISAYQGDMKLTSPDAVAHILRKAKDWTRSYSRRKEERKENRGLVDQLKEKIA